jgi:hypothetical protein
VDQPHGTCTDADLERVARLAASHDRGYAITPAVFDRIEMVAALDALDRVASSKASGPQPRRVLHIEYTAGVDLGRGIELAVG